MADCCTHQGADEHGCWDCYNTGHTHDANQPCVPNPENASGASRNEKILGG